MKRLKAEEIANLPNVEQTEIKIDAWDVSIVVQGISKATQIVLGRSINQEEKDAFEYQRELLKACVIDPVLTDELIDELYKKDSQIVDLIFAEINNLNGFGGSADAETFQ